MSEVQLNKASVYLGELETPVLQAIDLSVESGEILVLLGFSGSGKTTLLRSINRLVPLRSGNIRVRGQDTAGIDPVKLRLSIGYVVQGAALFPHRTVEENVAVVPGLLDWNEHRISERVERLLQLVQLDPEVYRKRFPEQLSGGEQQRVGVARALAVEPSLVLMDEPFGALDPLTRESLRTDFQSLQKRLGFTAILVTHDITEALLLADRIAVLSHGRIAQIGTPREILLNPASSDVEQMLTTPRRQADIWQGLLGV